MAQDIQKKIIPEIEELCVSCVREISPKDALLMTEYLYKDYLENVERYEWMKPFGEMLEKFRKTKGSVPPYLAINFDGTYIWVGRRLSSIDPRFVIVKKFVHLRKWDFIPGVNIIFPVTNITSNYTVKVTLISDNLNWLII